MTTEGVVKKPRFCCWVLNYRCMLRCKMCYIWNTQGERDPETSMEQKKAFVASLKGFVDPGFEFHLSGGEPLLTEGILDLTRFIVDEGYKVNLVTNGFLVNESLAKQIVSSGLHTITFSLDGATAKTHDFLRGIEGSYDKILRAIDYVDGCRTGTRPSIAILTTIMQRNMDELLVLTERVNGDPRIEMISFQAITQPFSQAMDNDWFTKEENRFLWPQDSQKTSDTMETLRALKVKGYKIGNQPNHFLHFREYFKSPNTFLKKIKCNLGDYEFHVDPYGKAFFCCLMEPFGNIKGDRIPEVWHAPRTQGIRQNVYSCKKNCHIMINCFYEDESLVSAHGQG